MGGEEAKCTGHGVRVVSTEISGIIFLRLVMEDSKDVGYCSSFKMEVSSTD